MPSRKNRPDKHGKSPSLPTTKDKKSINKAKELVSKFRIWERNNPGDMHYVGWPDMAEARLLERNGFLKEGHAENCFYVTEKLKQAFKDKSMWPTDTFYPLS